MAAEILDTAHRTFVSYIDRTREFYRAQGYEKPYRWARFLEVPFARPVKPLAETRIGVITTAGRELPAKAGDGVLRGGKQVWSGSTEAVPERFYTDDLAWDKQATHMDDVDSFLPVRQLHELAAAGRIGAVAPRFYGVPTDYSQRRTREQDAPEILQRLREDEVDAALLVPI